MRLPIENERLKGRLDVYQSKGAALNMGVAQSSALGPSPARRWVLIFLSQFLLLCLSQWRHDLSLHEINRA